MASNNSALQKLQKNIDKIADKLCLAVQGEFDFMIDITDQDANVQKLTMLINFVLDSARRALLEAREKNNKLEELDQLKSDFMANISHELRTPLMLILGPLENTLNKATDLPDTLIQDLKRMQRNAIRLYTLVNDILDFSKIEAGKFTLHEEPLDLREVISTLVDDARGLAQERQLTLTFIAPDTLPKILIDRKIIEKIVLNLISNALKFTPEFGAITIQLEQKDNNLHLSVSDTGIGIPEAQICTIFERFHQVDSSSTRMHEGTGLGLALIQQFVALMDGHVSVNSEEGKGTTFIVVIPAKVTTEDVSAYKADTHRFKASPLQHIPLKTSAHPDISIPNDSNKPLLLIADDNPDIQAYMISLLKDEFEIISTDNGLSALELAKEHHPLVILSDIMMPEMDGYELVAALKADAETNPIPIILITAKTGAEAVSSSLNAGAYDYLSKPFSAAELIARTHAALRQHKAYLKNLDLNNQLINLARRAGMADIATSVLHNVGNVLNSVNVSLNMIQENIKKPHVKNLFAISNMLQQNLNNLISYLTEDPKGKILPQYMVALSQEINTEYLHIDEEVQLLAQQIKHIKDIVVMQQSVSGATGLSEKIFLPDIVNTATAMCKSSIEKRNIKITKEIKDNLFLTTDKNKLLQILINLIQNANDALSLPEHQPVEKKIYLKIEKSANKQEALITISDNGVGIDDEQLNKIFSFGYTTKPTGHGFGLHSSSLAAKELGGSLQVKSDGLSYGATFILTLPLNRAFSLSNETVEE